MPPGTYIAFILQWSYSYIFVSFISRKVFREIAVKTALNVLIS